MTSTNSSDQSSTKESRKAEKESKKEEKEPAGQDEPDLGFTMFEDQAAAEKPKPKPKSSKCMRSNISPLIAMITMTMLIDDNR